MDWQTFLSMISPSVGGVAEDDLLAILKRSVVLVAGYRAVYLRLPSPSKSAPIFMYTNDDVANDWFQQGNMWTYGAWSKGSERFPSGFDDAKAAETTLISELLAQPNGEPTQEESAQTGAQLLRKKWTREWDGSQPESLDAAAPPGWYRLVPQEMRDRLFQFVVDSVGHYGSLTTATTSDMCQTFGIDDLSAWSLIRYFTYDLANYTHGAAIPSGLDLRTGDDPFAGVVIPSGSGQCAGDGPLPHPASDRQSTLSQSLDDEAESMREAGAASAAAAADAPDTDFWEGFHDALHEEVIGRAQKRDREDCLGGGSPSNRSPVEKRQAKRANTQLDSQTTRAACSRAIDAELETLIAEGVREMSQR